MQKSLISLSYFVLLCFFRRLEQNSYCGIILSNVDFLSVLRAAWHLSSSKESEFSYTLPLEEKDLTKPQQGCLKVEAQVHHSFRHLKKAELYQR